MNRNVTVLTFLCQYRIRRLTCRIAEKKEEKKTSTSQSWWILLKFHPQSIEVDTNFIPDFRNVHNLPHKMTQHFKKKHSIDDLVHYVTLHKVHPIALRAIVWPFVVFYLICLGFISQTDEDNYEVGFIALAAVGCVHILTVLCCYWSVHIAAFLNCRKVTTII